MAAVITGGRNISLSYYGIDADGSSNPDTYLDAELLLCPGESVSEGLRVSHVAEIYFSLLNSYRDNRYILGRVPLHRLSAYSERGELNPQLVDSAAWRAMLDHPQLKVYETGRHDDRAIGERWRPGPGTGTVTSPLRRTPQFPVSGDTSPRRLDRARE